MTLRRTGVCRCFLHVKMEWGQIILLSIWLLLMVDVCRTAGMEPSLKIMSRRKVLVISLDGFGHHYLDKYPWRYLATNLYSAGSYPRKFRNQFVTKTFPNHFSVATGLYEEVHGVIGNNIYDSSLNKTFGMDDKELFMQNPLVSPVWTLNEEHGGHSGCIMWPGCGVAYRGKNVTFLSPFHQHALFNESIDKSIEWFTNERTPANLIFLYHEEPDHVGHIYGPNSSQVEEELRKIDEGIGYLYQMLTVHKLRDTVDVIVMSDHGMSAVKEENVIFLDDIVDSSLYHISGTSPLLNVWTTFEKQLEVYSSLLEGSRTHNYTVYLKEDPQFLAWHYSKNTRISQISILAAEGYVFKDFKNYIDYMKKKGATDLTDTHGNHGYPVDIPNMEPIFVAAGPSFKRGFKAPDFSNIDTYMLLCHLLNLAPGPNNGTADNISSILVEPISSTLIRPLSVTLVALNLQAPNTMNYCEMFGRARRLVLTPA
ncbi:ectonucleotide pyrophosphatase/phosphodiesterase family member 5-like isoform X2 [Cherax quadricarinatus]|uniref:ectonucleotide pyrophosphatase/phosphodiesterase family member 5-like isoform X2 n=1 Tax=Cherax quadricarinatus TaxID=27406 RepID=UPI00387EA950